MCCRYVRKSPPQEFASLFGAEGDFEIDPAQKDLWGLPRVFGVGMKMQTANGCERENDQRRLIPRKIDAYHKDQVWGFSS